MNNYTFKFKIFLSRLKNGKHFIFPASLDYYQSSFYFVRRYVWKKEILSLSFYII